MGVTSDSTVQAWLALNAPVHHWCYWWSTETVLLGASITYTLQLLCLSDEVINVALIIEPTAGIHYSLLCCACADSGKDHRVYLQRKLLYQQSVYVLAE